jgi:selenocysteine lyase/cysteine desulfurase
MAGMLGAAPEEIAFVENATRGWDMAFYGLPLGEGDRILTHGSEYVSNWLGMVQLAKRRGVEIDLVPSDGTGQIDVAALERMIGPRTRLIALTHVPTQGGLVNPAEEVGRVAAAHGVTFMLDACQSAGQMPLEVGRLGCQILSGTGRKFRRGPRGTGFLYVARELADTIEPPFVDLRSTRWTGPERYELAPGARRFENWESYVAGRAGLAAAVRYARGLGLATIEARVTALAARLREALAAVPGVSLHDAGARKCGIVSFALAGEPPSGTMRRLAGQGINMSVTPATSALIDFAERGLGELGRASVHYYNTEEEVDRFAAAVAGRAA